MNVRSVTVFTDLRYPLQPAALQTARAIASAARSALVEAGYTVQTVRLASQPLAEILPEATPGQAIALARDLAVAATDYQVDYVALGPVRLDDPPGHLKVVLPILEAAANVFCSLEVARPGVGIDLARLLDAAGIVREAAFATPDGFTNLRLAALANVRPWSPFFPAAYHGGGAARVALACESADLAVDALRGAGSLASARRGLVSAIEGHAEHMERAVTTAVAPAGGQFQGIDFSLAPFPEDSRSIGAALEQLGLERVGQSGTLAAAAFLADSIDRARFTRTGFCGLMLPLLEDAVLARRAAEGALTVSELLMASAVCGTGLDTIPLPGDITAGQIAAILLDVGALALRLDKELTARLMPLPGKKAGDPVHFEFEYFADSAVLAGPGFALSGLFAGAETIEIGPRGTT